MLDKKALIENFIVFSVSYIIMLVLCYILTKLITLTGLIPFEIFKHFNFNFFNLIMFITFIYSDLSQTD